MFVYQTENLKNSKKYIGVCTFNSDSYLGSGTLIKSAIRKYGRKNFKRTILEHCSTLEEVYSKEIYYIKKYNAVKSKDYYNLSYGGYGSNSESIKEYWSKIEDKKTVRNWSRVPTYHMLGKKHSEETKKLIGSKSVNRNWGRKTPVTGHNNPKSKECYVNGKHYQCLKYFWNENKHIPYTSLTSLARIGKKSLKWNLEISYV
jgi:group I intron endonuclease